VPVSKSRGRAECWLVGLFGLKLAVRGSSRLSPLNDWKYPGRWKFATGGAPRIAFDDVFPSERVVALRTMALGVYGTGRATRPKRDVRRIGRQIERTLPDMVIRMRCGQAGGKRGALAWLAASGRDLRFAPSTLTGADAALSKTGDDALNHVFGLEAGRSASKRLLLRLNHHEVRGRPHE